MKKSNVQRGLPLGSFRSLLRATLILLICSAMLVHAPDCEAAVPKKKKSRKIKLRKTPARIVQPYVPKRAPKAQPARAIVIPPKEAIQLQPPTLKSIDLKFQASGYPVLENFDALQFIDESRSYAIDKNGNKIQFTLAGGLQLEARSLLQKHAVPWGAIVAIDPRTGKVLALASHSTVKPGGPEVATKATFPAASLFKLVTAAAAIERAGMDGGDLIYFRGGNYTLERYNYLPDRSKDRRSISFADALGKSVNPAFARVGLSQLSRSLLERYALNFGFNSQIPFEAPLEMSRFDLPDDDYLVARTAAGFGEVTISPLHAAVLTGAIANHGLMMKPYLIDRITDPRGAVRYQSHPTPLRTAIMRSTSEELLTMMQATVETGTARKQFLRVRNPALKSLSIAAKTGTLRGKDPEGTYHWFVAAVPAENPEIAISALVIDPGYSRVGGSALARELLEYYFKTRGRAIETRSERQVLRKNS